MSLPFMRVFTDGQGVLGRRSFLKQLSLGGAAATAGVMSVGWRDLVIANAAELRKKAKSMILLWMDGGPSQFETFNPKVGSKNQGPAGAISTKLPGLQFAEYWPKTAQVADKIALIRSMQSNEADHFRAIKLVRTGYPINPSIPYPTWGSVVARDRYDEDYDLPAYVRVGKPRIKTRDVNSGVLGAKVASFNVDNPNKIPDNVVPLVDQDTLRRRLSLTDQFDAEFANQGAASVVREKKDIYDRTSRFVMSSRINVFDLEKEPAKVRDTYGRSSFGQGCLLARRLVEAGVSFIEVFGIGSSSDQGWDTHARGFEEMPGMCAETDQGYAALLNDLSERGMLDSTLVVWMGEFGRTPTIKKDGGRDHYPKGWLAGLSGGGVKMGQVIGATDKDGVAVTERPVGVQDLFVSFCHSLGLDPRSEYHTPADQPLKLVKGGELVKELF